MRLITRTLICCAFCVVARSAVADPDVVGDAGDPDRIQFSGNTTYGTDQLRSALGFDLDILLAGHPDGPRDELLTLLERRLLDGYLHAGFAEARVTARFDELRSVIVVTIVEGPRFRSRNVEITGAATLPARQLQSLLTSTHPDQAAPKGLTPPSAPRSQPAVWQVGEPASFFEGDWRTQQEAIQQQFQALGYYDARFTATTRSDAGGAATLVVAIQDEGPRSVLGEIEIVGTHKNSVEEVIRYLDLPAGTLLNAERKRQIERRLRDSARFLRHDVQILTPPFGNAPSILRIKLVEYADAPRLSEPLSDDEQCLVRLADWINSFESTGEDVELRLTGQPSAGTDSEQEPAAGTLFARGRAVVSHRHQGWVLHASLLEHPQTEICEMWIHVTAQGVTLASPKHRLRYEVANVRQSVNGTIAWSAHPPDAEGRISAFQFGMGAKGNRDGKLPPFVLQMSAAPVAALREAHSHRVERKDGVLTLNHGDDRMAIDIDTGRLINLELSLGSHTRLMVKSDSGLYQTAMAEFQRQTAGSRIIPAGDVPISNLLTFLTTCIPERIPGRDGSPSTVLTSLSHRLLKRGAFHAFDSLLLDLLKSTDDRFRIPPDSNPRKQPVNVDWTAVILPITRGMVSRPSWPWTVSREFVFARSRYSQRAGQSIHELLAAPQTGPVANLASAWAFGQLSPRLRVEFARRGLMRMQRARFQQDCEPFLRTDAPIGRLLLASAQTLQETDDAELQALVDQVPLAQPDRLALERVLRVFPAQRTEPADAVLRAALDEAWEPLIEPRLRRLLEVLETGLEQ